MRDAESPWKSPGTYIHYAPYQGKEFVDHSENICITLNLGIQTKHCTRFSTAGDSLLCCEPTINLTSDLRLDQALANEFCHSYLIEESIFLGENF